MTTDRFAAFPNAPTPTSLPEALALLEETRRLLAEECRQRANLTSELTEALDKFKRASESRIAMAQDLRRVAEWLAAASPSADDIIAAIDRSDDAHSKDLIAAVAKARAAEAELQTIPDCVRSAVARWRDPDASGPVPSEVLTAMMEPNCEYEGDTMMTAQGLVISLGHLDSGVFVVTLPLEVVDMFAAPATT